MGEVPKQFKEHAWKKGQSGNPSGRPKGSLKTYVATKLAKMSDKEKDEYLKDINKDLQWRMGEGNPHQTTDGILEVTLPKPLLGGQSNDSDNNSDKETTKTQE